MEELRRFGADAECTSDELISKLVHLQISTLQHLRCEIFEEAKSAQLVGQSDIFVQRQKRASIQTKLATDIATIVYNLRNRKYLPRTLLRNGKRSKERYDQLKSKLSENKQGRANTNEQGKNPSKQMRVTHNVTN